MERLLKKSFKGFTSQSKRKYDCRAQRRQAYFADALVASLLRTRNVLATLKHRQVFRCACWVRSASLFLSRRFGHNTAHRQRSSFNLCESNITSPYMESVFVFIPLVIQSSALNHATGCVRVSAVPVFSRNDLHALSLLERACTHPCLP